MMYSRKAKPNALRRYLKRLTPEEEYAVHHQEKTSENLHHRLIPSSQEKLATLTARRRQVVWGTTQLKYRIRSYKASKDERISLVLPNFNRVELYSPILGRKVQLDMELCTLRHIEGMGGLDEYLLKTSDAQLKSDVASQLRWKVLCARRQQEYETWTRDRGALQTLHTAGVVAAAQAAGVMSTSTQPAQQPA